MDAETPANDAEKVAVPSDRRRTERAPITTLVGYLASRTAPTTFLKDLREANVWVFADDDMKEALDRNRQLDPNFTRTAALLAASIKAKDDRHVLPASGYAQRALGERLRDYPRWIGADWTELPPDEAAIRVAAAVAATFTDAKRGREARSVFSVALMLLARDLKSETAVRALARAFDTRAEPSARWERERILFVGTPRSKVPELRALAQLLLPWLERADALSSDLEDVRAALKDEQSGRERAEGESRARGERVARLEEEKSELEGRIRTLQEELRANEIHGKHQVEQTRSAVRGLLDGRVGSLLSAAADALDLDPPRTNVAREQLQAARDAIQEHTK